MQSLLAYFVSLCVVSHLKPQCSSSLRSGKVQVQRHYYDTAKQEFFLSNYTYQQKPIITSDCTKTGHRDRLFVV